MSSYFDYFDCMFFCLPKNHLGHVADHGWSKVSQPWGLRRLRLRPRQRGRASWGTRGWVFRRDPGTGWRACRPSFYVDPFQIGWSEPRGNKHKKESAWIRIAMGPELSLWPKTWNLPGNHPRVLRNHPKSDGFKFHPQKTCVCLKTWGESPKSRDWSQCSLWKSPFFPGVSSQQNPTAPSWPWATARQHHSAILRGWSDVFHGDDLIMVQLHVIDELHDLLG